MKTSYLIYLAILLNSCTLKKSTCYNCLYDIVEEKLCISNGKFEFEMIAPFYSKIIVNGKYKLVGDTLVFNPGVKQVNLEVLGCEVQSTNMNGNYIKLMNQNNIPLKLAELKVNNEWVSMNREGILQLKDKFSSDYVILTTTLSNKLWPLAYQNETSKINIDCNQGEGNFLVVKLNLSKELKIPFEYETKLLKKGEELFYVRENGSLMDLKFKLIKNAI